MKRTIATILAVLILFSALFCTACVTSAASGATLSYAFSGDEKSKAGFAEGTISLTVNNSSSAGNYYLYWADNTKALDGYRYIATLNVANGSTGTYKMLDQAVIQDPATGEILYNLAQEDMVALRVVMRLGWEIPNPINALNPDEAVRFPFASLAPKSGNTLTTQTLTVTVKDNAGTPVAIEGAKVTVGGISKKTNASGVATFSLQKGEYPMMVKKDGMVATDVVTVASSAVSKSITLK